MDDQVKTASHERNDERGAVMALAAISGLALILAVGLCVDISHFYLVRTEMQNAADAAALAGASALNGKAVGITLAQQRAVSEMNNFEFNNNDINFDATPQHVYYSTDFAALETFLYGNAGASCDEIANGALPAGVSRVGGITTDAQAQPVRFVGVCVPAPQATGVSFASNVLNPIVIRGKAIAGHSPPLTGICDIVAPMALVDDPSIPNSTTVDADGNVVPGEFTGTHTYQLRDGPGGDGITPGNYQLLEICGPGGSNVRDALQGNCEGCFGIGDTVPPKTGVTAGPVRQGWNSRFGSDKYVAQNITHDQYETRKREYTTCQETPGGCGTSFPDMNADGDWDRRILVVPVIEQPEFCNGSGCVLEIVNFASFFLKSEVPGGNGGEITAEFIGFRPIPNGEYDPNETPIPSLTTTVLYR